MKDKALKGQMPKFATDAQADKGPQERPSLDGRLSCSRTADQVTQRTIPRWHVG